MFFNIFGSLTSAVIRLAVTAATILLVYFFILKPILKTTENVSGGFNADESIQKVLDSVSETLSGEGNGIQQQIERQLRGLNSDGKSRRAERLLRCVQNAAGDSDRMQRCARRFAS